MRRFADEASAAAFEASKEAELMRLRAGSPNHLAVCADRPTIADVSELCLSHLLATGNVATYRRIKSSFDNWVKSTIGWNISPELCPALYAAPIVAKLKAGGNPKAEQTALAVLTRFAVSSGIWPPEPWGPGQVVAREVKAAHRRAARRAADQRAAALGPFGPQTAGTTPDQIRSAPDWHLVDALADNVALWQIAGPAGCEHCSDARARRRLPDDLARRHGESFRTMAATGVRPAELLALHSSDIARETGQVSITRQLDRYRPWTGTAPPVLAPKGGRARRTTCLAFFLPRLVALAEDADRRTSGWLFPPTKGQRAWLAAWAASFGAGVRLMNHRREHAIEVGVATSEAPPAWA